MTSLSEQFQAARQTGLDHQLSLLRSVGDGMLDRTSRVFSLHLDLSRATVEHASSAMRQLLAVRDPRELLTIGAQSQQQLRTMFDYGQELFNIAAGLRGAALRPYSVEVQAAAPALPAPPDAVEAAVEAVARSAQQAATASDAIAAPAAPPAPVPEPEQVLVPSTGITPDFDLIVTSGIAPPVEPTPIARATSAILGVALAPHPVAASVPVEVAVEIELPKVEPVDAAPALAAPPSSGSKVTEIRGGRGRKKQS